MVNHIKEADLAFYMMMNGAEFLGFDSDSQCYNLESDQTKSKWRLAFLRSDFSAFARGVSELINIKKEVN